LSTPDELSSFVESFRFVGPHQEIGLSGKRSAVTKNIKTASELPSTTRLHFHNEYARSNHFPEIIFFFSEKVPEQGGQTPLLSSLELFDRLEAELPQFIHDLTSKGVCISPLSRSGPTITHISTGVIGRQYYPSVDDPDWKEIGWNWKVSSTSL
jgi:hypothetical protein